MDRPWPYRLSSIMAVLLVLTDLVIAVDRTNFKTCQQSSFCRRHRNLKEGDLKYAIVPDTVTEIGNGIEADIKEEQSGVVLRLKLSVALNDHSVLRMHVDQPGAERARYEAKDALLDNIEFSKLTIESRSADGFTAKFGDDGKVMINYNPFRIDLYKNDRHVISGNQRGLLKWEHFRHKGEGDQEKGMWEEHFKSHTDSKPYGPMSVGMDFSMIDFEHVYGIPEHADSFALKNTKGHTDPYRLYNVDIFEYVTQSPMALYGSVPMMVAHASDVTVGLLWLNPSDTWIDIESGEGGDTKSRLTHWISETGVIDVWFMMGPKPSDVAKQNAQLTGTTSLPPYYSIGYHQCRWNYFTQEEVAAVDDGFDEHDIPLDAIWLDIEYTEGRSKKYFTWDPIGFSDYKTLISNLTTKGRRLVTIIDPHLKKDSYYPVLNEAIENNYLIKDKNGRDFDGWCWPGASMWPDFINPEVRKWWSGKFKPEFFPGFANGIVDIWNDMNEPSVFNGPEVSVPRDVRHFGGWENRDVHNIYAMLMIKATHDGLIEHRQNLRPYILMRGFFAGAQRYGSAWTGDNMGKWDHLKESIPMLLSLSMVGITFSGADVPGFFYNPESTEMVVRWYQAGAFQPFFRAHAHMETRHREPWTFDEQTMLLIRDAIRARYSYLPYMYTLFRENSMIGSPIMRPLWYHFPTDSKTFAIDHSYLLGPALLIQPVVTKGTNSIDVYFPGDSSIRWYDLETKVSYEGGSTNTVAAPLSKIPIFQRSGTIVTRRERMRRSAALTLDDPVSLDVVLDVDGKSASGHLYLDDGSSFNYRDKQDYVLAEIGLNNGRLSYRIVAGKHQSKVWLERITVCGITSKPSQVSIVDGDNTKSLQFKYDSETNVLVIRKPGVNMSKDWQISVDYY